MPGKKQIKSETSSGPFATDGIEEYPSRRDVADDDGTQNSVDTPARKRRIKDEVDSQSTSSGQKKRRSTTKERSAADPYHPDNKLVDSLRLGLMLVFIGLNPGLQTAATGLYYASTYRHRLHI